ncbi:hypothetical protein Zmor_014428 [Zophobas morio]|uniref:Uncharacterized protein n=1 Tax=Zophobas morio TaxID=2755281 RepID=A0AA38IHL2_9CUCU|nr:hypothetical protein Zmor_014428 [Zophobas morio]
MLDLLWNFFKMVDKTFDILNSVNIWGKVLKGPITLRNKRTIKENLKVATDYFYNLYMPDKVTLVVNSRRKVPIIGFLLDRHSMISIAEELVWSEEPPLEFLLGRNFSQDHIDTFFSR